MIPIYTDNKIHRTKVNNLEVLTKLFDNGQRSEAELFAILKDTGIDEDTCIFAIDNYSNNYKKNNTMKFNLDSVINILTDVRNKLSTLTTENKNSINYSANTALNTVNSYLNTIYNINKKVNELKTINESDAKYFDIKQSIGEAFFCTKPEFYFLNSAYNELYKYNDLVPVYEFSKSTQKILQENFYTNYLTNTVFSISNNSNKGFYDEAIEDISFLLKNDEQYIKENLSTVLHKHFWIPELKNIINEHAKINNKVISTNEAVVEELYSPVQANKDGSFIFKMDNILYKIYEKSIIKLKNYDEVQPKFMRLFQILENFKIDKNKLKLYKPSETLEVVFEKNMIKINDIDCKNDLEIVKNAIIATSFYRLDELYKVNDLLLLIENFNTVKNIDLVTRLVGRNGSIINLIKLSEKDIFINRLNPDYNLNELYKAIDFEHAQMLVNEYFNFDISVPAYELLETEKQVQTQLNIEKQKYNDRLEFLNSKLKEIKKINEDLNDKSLIDAIELLKSEIRKNEVDLQKVYTKISNK